MGMFSSISNNAQQGLNQAQAVAGRPNVGIGRPGFQDFDNWLGPAPITDSPPEMAPPMPAPTPAPMPQFKTTWQELGYKSLEEMQDALDPGFRNNPYVERWSGPVPPSEQQPQMQQPISQPPAMQMPMPQQQPQMQQPISQPPAMQMPPGLPTGSAPGGKSGDNFSPGSNYRQAPGQRPGVEIGSPGGLMPEQFTGGLRPAPRNFRPPQRRPGGILRQRTRR